MTAWHLVTRWPSYPTFHHQQPCFCCCLTGCLKQPDRGGVVVHISATVPTSPSLTCSNAPWTQSTPRDFHFNYNITLQFHDFMSRKVAVIYCCRCSTAAAATTTTAACVVRHLGTSMTISLQPLTPLPGFLSVPRTDRNFAVDLIRTAVGLSSLLVRRYGIRYLTNSETRHMVQTVLNSSLRQSCSVSY